MSWEMPASMKKGAVCGCKELSGKLAMSREECLDAKNSSSRVSGKLYIEMSELQLGRGGVFSSRLVAWRLVEVIRAKRCCRNMFVGPYLVVIEGWFLCVRFLEVHALRQPATDRGRRDYERSQLRCHGPNEVNHSNFERSLVGTLWDPTAIPWRTTALEA